MYATHFQLSVNATTAQQHLTQNELVDALDKLANAVMSKNDMVEIQMAIIKSQQITIDSFTTKNAQLIKIVDTISHRHPMNISSIKP